MSVSKTHIQIRFVLLLYPLDILFVAGWPLPPKLLYFQSGCSEKGYIQGQLFQVNRGEEVSDALILSQAQEVLPPIKREGQRRSEGDKALLIFRGGFGGGGHGGDSSW